jgi:hypothetical protein
MDDKGRLLLLLDLFASSPQHTLVKKARDDEVEIECRRVSLGFDLGDDVWRREEHHDQSSFGELVGSDCSELIYACLNLVHVVWHVLSLTHLESHKFAQDVEFVGDLRLRVPLRT